MDTHNNPCDILLPSNEEWRMRNYYRLVEQQRELGGNPRPEGETQRESKKPRLLSESPGSGLSLSQSLSMETTWTVSDIAKAGHLLTNPPRPLSFSDEEEVRRVYSLIYDVFRYKSVLNQALLHTSFYVKCPQFQNQPHLMALLFYDLYRRRFLPPDLHAEPLRSQMLEAADLREADALLWDVRIKLAASLSRLRIKNRAQNLSQLLPPHLRDARVSALKEAPVTAWINTFKINTNDVTRLLETAGLKGLETTEQRPDVLSYVHDDLCPKFVKFHPTQRSDLAQSTLVKRNHIVLQDRAFCLGPAVMCKILRDLELAGKLAQTHPVSPRTTAYLASVLSDNRKIHSLITFGVGERKAEYDAYLRQLGVTNAEVRAERFVDVPSDSWLLESVVGVLATPPNTYSAVTDPVGLVCSRNGDLSMLELLTEVEDWREKRIDLILQEQRQTLRLSMSRPQIQAVLYETHSVVPAENTDMVALMLHEMNLSAREKHIEEWGKSLQALKREGLDPAAGSGDENAVPLENLDMKDSERPKFTEADITVPPCDVFQLHDLPGLSSDQDICVALQEVGCFLAYLRRKEVVRLNAKYMINIAASRGLFGDKDGAPKETRKTPSVQQHRKKPDLQQSTSGSPLLVRPKSRRFEIERIAAPTQASVLRRAISPSGSPQQGSSPCSSCSRHQSHFRREITPIVGMNPKMVAQIKRQDARKWWRETAGYVIMRHQNATDRRSVPALKLSRTRPCYKVPLHVGVASIQFDGADEFL